MGVRNCRDIGENLQKIVKKLMKNDRLVNLLYYTDKDPYSGAPLTDVQKQNEIFNKRIRMIPVLNPQETAVSTIAISAIQGRTLGENDQFKEVTITVEVFVPVTQWIIKDSNLRPYAIMGEVQESLNGLTINGLGKLTGGDFDYNFGTDEITAFMQIFTLTSYD